ncbi:MAG: DUF1257 domain-containing protein [Candidatus Obscuribacterales bacterium]|nr:DUF1257 domain-containing protein [Candidatus Obscuribacterales bacterium]
MPRIANLAVIFGTARILQCHIVAYTWRARNQVSHYTKIKTSISDAAFLVKALNDLGFAHVDRHETAQNLYGYQNDRRTQTAEVIIRKQYVGAASNDIGFSREADGSLSAIISEFDQLKYGAAWLNQVTQRYAYHAVINKLAEQGFSIESEHAEKGQIKISLSRMS